MLKNLFTKKHTVETFKKLLHNKPPNLNEIKDALNSNIDINFIDTNGESFLHYTIKKNLTTCANFLIEFGIDVCNRDNDDKTPIYLAVEKSNRILTQVLLETKKVNINTLQDNRTLLQEAVIQGEKHIINMLLKTNINKNHVDNHGRSIIFDAIANGNEKIIDTVLETKDLELNIIDEDKKTILHQTNVIKDDQLAIKLIKKGADPTIVDGEGKSYLLYAALRGIETEAIIDAALETGFNINSQVRNKNSILMEIMFSFSKLSESENDRRDNLMSMATKLVRKGIDVTALNDKGETVLFDAVRKLDIEACVFLIKEGVPINVINHHGDNVVSAVMYKGVRALDIIYLLLRYKADVNIKNKKGQNLIEVLNDIVLYTHNNVPIDQQLVDKIESNGQYLRLLKEVLINTSFDTSKLSSEGEPIFFKSLLYDNKALFDLYYKFGININAVDKNGDTIFIKYVDKIAHMEVVPQDFRDMLLILIMRKSDINMQDKNGKTILSRLISNNNVKMFRILFSVTRFNYTIQDNRGFTIIHDCISTSNITVIKLINQIEPKLKNTPDYAGILPITYAALFGNIELVLELINLESNFKSAKAIPTAVKQKLSPLLKNLDRLYVEDENELHKLNIFKDQVRRDFQ